jgi:thioredoxin reductase
VTSIPDVFAAGDMTRRASMPLPGAQVTVAAEAPSARTATQLVHTM